MRAVLLSIFLIAAVFVAGCTQTNSNTQNGGTQQGESSSNVEIINFSYEPSSITIKVGDTVTWTNMDSVRHTVTSDVGNELDSSALSKGETYSHTFNNAGIFDYHCTIHPYMKGSVTVE